MTIGRAKGETEMAASGHCSIRLFLTSTLIASLIASLLCGAVRGDDLGAGKSFRIRAAAFAPIGRVYSLGEISINGRRVYGEQNIWGGELLQAFADASACVVLDSVGQVVLERAATVRLATRLSFNCETESPVLIISLLNGSVKTQLQPGASSYIEAAGSSLTAKNGASFRVGIHQGQVVVDIEIGEVRAEASALQPLPIGHPVNVDSGGKPTGTRSNTIKTRPNAVEKISILLTDQVTKIALSPGRLVRFLLLTPGKANFNSQEVTVPTNDYGVATATFTAGPNPGETEVTATVVGFSVPSWKGRITIEKPSVVRNRLLLGGAAAAVIIVVVKWHGDPRPLKQEPPPVIP